MTESEKLQEAEDALHELSLGKRVVKISRNGKAIEYSAANMTDLRRYITELKQSINGTARRPMRVTL